MWCSTLTIFKQRRALRTAGLLALCVALITTLFFANISLAAPGINKTIAFQGRLQYANGGVVADGHYNIQFKIYQDGSGTAAGNPGGTLKWTESHVNDNNDEGIEVKSGYFSVNLGSVNPFGTQVDWNQDTLWLSMNIAGSDDACTTFGTAPCTADGEMLPMQRLTATPYSLNSGAVGGKTADDLVQLGQGVQSDASNNSSVYINKTGSGNLIQLQNNGSDVFTVANDGDLILGGDDDKAISLSQSATDTPGSQLTIEAGAGGTGNGAAGGDLVLKGGAAGGTAASGGNLILAGGAGTGSGAPGLVILNTPTFSTVTDDANCFANGAIVASSCTITTSTVNTSAAVLVGFSTTGQVATLPDPTITTAGRIIYIMAASGSKDFTLRANTGGGEGIEQNITMRQNTAATMIWNGTDWTAVGASSTTTLQDAYDNTPDSAGGAELLLTDTSDSDGLTIRDSETDSVSGPLLSVQTGSAANIFSITSNVNELASNGGAETMGSSSTAFPSGTWGAAGTATVTRQATTGDYIATGQGSVKVEATAAASGAYNKLNTALTPETTYNVSLSVRLESGSFNDFAVSYAPDGTTSSVTCASDVAIATTKWTKVTCSFETPASGIDSNNSIVFGQIASSTRTFYVDNFSVTLASDSAPNVQIGGGGNGGPATLFTLDKSASAPTASNSDALLGSMYYDTTLGKVQCYEAQGWGNCGAAPDFFVTLSPEYSNAVMNGAGEGAMTSDICSDSLDINDGSSAQPTICGTNETFNFYNWVSPEITDQTKSIYVTYQLPSTFKKFVADETSLMGRTDSTDALVTYQIYRNNSTTGLTECGDPIEVSTGVKTTWQKAIADDTDDPSECSFEAGDSIVFRINLTSKNDANAYVSNLGFVFSNN